MCGVALYRKGVPGMKLDFHRRLAATRRAVRLARGRGDEEYVAGGRHCREAMARWLRTFRWSFVATPTFRQPVSEAAARWAVAAWLAPLGPAVYAAVAVERGRVEGRVHAHVLVIPA